MLEQTPTSQDIIEEVKLRPSQLDNFIGQNKLKANLKTFIEATKIRNSHMDHVLFYGPPGLGKTTLSNIISYELNTSIHTTSGPMLSKVSDLAAMLSNLKPNDILFIDEIHRLPISVEEVLYSAMEDFRLDIIIGSGPAARTIKIDISPFTLIGATTRMGLLSNPLLGRFGILMGLEFYTSEELSQVVTNCCKMHHFNIETMASLAISSRSRGTPRIAIRLARRIMDFSIVEGKTIITHQMVNKFMNNMNVDPYGLEERDLKYITFIAEKCNGGPVGIETIVAALSDDKSSIEEVIEPFLIQEGFIQKTPRGRILTPKSIDHIGLKS